MTVNTSVYQKETPPADRTASWAIDLREVGDAGHSTSDLVVPALAVEAVFSRWSDQAACLRENPELFFPIGTGEPALAQAAEAKAVCNRCPVIDACLGYATLTGQDAGVWGGLTEEERRSLKRRAARPRAKEWPA